MAECVAQHLELAGGAVAGMDLDAAVTGVGTHRRRFTVGDDVGLDLTQQRGCTTRVRMRRLVDDDFRTARLDERGRFHGRARPRAQQRMGDFGGRVETAAQLDPAAEMAGVGPRDVGGMNEEEVDFADGSEGVKDGQLAGRNGTHPEQRDPARQCRREPTGGEIAQQLRQLLGPARHADGPPQVAPQLALPALIGVERHDRPAFIERAVAIESCCPLLDHLRAVVGVAVEQVGDPAGGGVASPRLAGFVVSHRRGRAPTRHRYRAGVQYL